MSANRGFTLVELVVSLFILSVCITLAWPVLDRAYQSHALETASSQLAWTLRSARSAAMLEGIYKDVRFYTSVDSYKSADGVYQLPTGVQYAGTPTFPSRVGSIPACIFNSAGAPSGGGTVVLKNKTNEKRYVIVNPVVGKVKVSLEPPDNW